MAVAPMVTSPTPFITPSDCRYVFGQRVMEWNRTAADVAEALNQQDGLVPHHRSVRYASDFDPLLGDGDTFADFAE